MADHVKGEMVAIMNALPRMRKKRDELRRSNDFNDTLRAQALDATIGDSEERLAELERKHPTKAQELR